MPDDIQPSHGIAPGAALRDLPTLAPPRSAWPAIQTALAKAPAKSRPSHWPWLAAAAALLLALALPRWIAPPAVIDAPIVRVPAAADETSELRALMAESAQLETLIAWSRDPDVESAPAASLGDAVQERIGHLDALLARADTDPEASLPLWQERVLRLRQLAELNSTQQWLAASGDADQGVPVLAF